MAKKTAISGRSLQDSLAESLKRAVPSVGTTATAAAPPSAVPAEMAMVGPAAPVPMGLPKGGLMRTSVTMKAAEHDRAEQILDVLKSCRQHRGGLTEAINIALRLCPLDPVLIGKAWDEYRATDLRVGKRKGVK